MTELQHGVWKDKPKKLKLWHGESVTIKPGDEVSFYRVSSHDYVFVDVKKKTDGN